MDEVTIYRIVSFDVVHSDAVAMTSNSEVDLLFHDKRTLGISAEAGAMICILLKQVHNGNVMSQVTIIVTAGGKLINLLMMKPAKNLLKLCLL
jgi:hypothetical protein